MDRTAAMKEAAEIKRMNEFREVIRKVYKPNTESYESALLKGLEIIDNMDVSERENLGSKSGTLHFVNLLGLGSSKRYTSAIIRNNKLEGYEKYPTPVGVTLRSDEDISVPVIDVSLNKDTGITPDKDIQYREVKAGEEFHLSLYEFMYLIIRPEYAGFFEANGDPKGAYFSAKLPAFWKGETKLPTPTIRFANGTGNIRDRIIEIDEQSFDGKWSIKPEYIRFSKLINKRKQSLVSAVAKILNETNELKLENETLRTEYERLKNELEELMDVNLESSTEDYYEDDVITLEEARQILKLVGKTDMTPEEFLEKWNRVDEFGDFVDITGVPLDSDLYANGFYHEQPQSRDSLGDEERRRILATSFNVEDCGKLIRHYIKQPINGFAIRDSKDVAGAKILANTVLLKTKSCFSKRVVFLAKKVDRWFDIKDVYGICADYYHPLKYVYNEENHHLSNELVIFAIFYSSDGRYEVVRIDYTLLHGYGQSDIDFMEYRSLGDDLFIEELKSMLV